jgi:hypothetical protein
VRQEGIVENIRSLLSLISIMLAVHCITHIDSFSMQVQEFFQNDTLVELFEPLYAAGSYFSVL